MKTPKLLRLRCDGPDCKNSWKAMKKEKINFCCTPCRIFYHGLAAPFFKIFPPNGGKKPPQKIPEAKKKWKAIVKKKLPA